MDKTVVIGLDGMDFELLDILVDKEVFENIGRLLKESTTAKLKSTAPPLTAPAWTSFATGKNPGKHSIYNFTKFKNGFSEPNIVNSSDIKGSTFYEILEESGFETTLINLPLSFPPRISGNLVTSFLTPSKKFIFPKELRQEFDLEGFKIGLEPEEKTRSGVASACRRYIESREEVLDSIHNKDWDFFFRLFSPTDWIQHAFYGDLVQERSSKEVLEVYKKIDEIVGKYLEEENNVILMSDHGFKSYEEIFYINKWLKEEGLLEIKDEKGSESLWGSNKLLNFISKNKYTRKIAYFLFDKLFNLLPLGTNAKIVIEEHLTPSIDFENSKAVYPIAEAGGIFINDSKHDNIVERKEELIKQVQSKLSRDFAGQVIRKEEVYSGEHVDEAPDLVFKRGRQHCASAVSSRLTREASINKHDTYGIFVARGPDIREEADLEEVSITDLAPTILRLYGLEVPDNMDGRILKDILVHSK